MLAVSVPVPSSPALLSPQASALVVAGALVVASALVAAGAFGAAGVVNASAAAGSPAMPVPAASAAATGTARLLTILATRMLPSRDVTAATSYRHVRSTACVHPAAQSARPQGPKDGMDRRTTVGTGPYHRAA